MSRELNVAERHIRQFGWSWQEVIIEFSLILFSALFVLFGDSEFYRLSIGVVGGFFSGVLDSWISPISGAIEGSEVATTSALALFWALVGSLIYFLYWAIRQTFYDAEDSFLEVFHDRHPKNYDSRKVFFLRLESKLLMVSFLIMMIAYGFIWSYLILEPILIDSIYIVNEDIGRWPWLFIYSITLVLSFHVFIILFRFVQGKQHVQYVSD